MTPPDLRPHDVAVQIRLQLDHLSPNDRRIADWIVEHEDEAPFETAESLAGKVGVSKAAVVRFGTRLGFGGFAGLRDALAYSARARLTRQNGEPPSGRGHVLDRWLASGTSALTTTRGLLSDAEIDAVADQLLKPGGRTYVLGQRKSAGLAEYLFFLLSPLVKNVQLLALGSATVADMLLDVSPQDRLVALTFRPYARLTGEVVDYFMQAGASVTLLTDEAAHAGVAHVLSCSPLSPGPFPSAIGPLYAIEALAASVSVRVHDEDRLNAVRDLWGRFGTF